MDPQAMRGHARFAGEHAGANDWRRICQPLYRFWPWLSRMRRGTDLCNQACIQLNLSLAMQLFSENCCTICCSLLATPGQHPRKIALGPCKTQEAFLRVPELCRPYFLPCLVAAVLAAVTLVLSIIFVDETLPSLQKAKPTKSGEAPQDPKTF